MSIRNWFRTRQTNETRRPRQQLGVQPLEDRTVPAVDFSSVMGIGHDAGASGANSVAVDAAGNSFLTGYFSGTTDFDPAHTFPGDPDILTSRGSNDIFVAKYAPDNTLIWARRMGGDNVAVNPADMGNNIKIDAAGNSYVTGMFTGSGDFGTFTRTSLGGYDGIVVKLNSNGVVQWANSWGTAANEQGKSVDTDSAGNVYAFDFRSDAKGIDVLKYSPGGVLAWTKSFDTNSSNTSDMAIDPAGNIYISGGFVGTVDFDPSTKTKNVNAGPGLNGFILKLTSAGSLSWVDPLFNLNNGSSDVQRILVDGAGNVIVGGFYGGQVDFNPGNGTTTLPIGGGGFIAKYTGNGSLVWAKALETLNSSGALIYGMALDSSGNIYATGMLIGQVDFDPGTGVAIRTSAGSSDVFVLKLDSLGNFGWAESFGGTGADQASGIDVDSAGNVYVVGRFQGTVDFDPDPVNESNLVNPSPYNRAFFLKLHQH